MAIFEEQLEFRMIDSQKRLCSKAKEYASDSDRFHNFNRAGQVLNILPEQALVGFMTKHFVSVLDIINDIEKGNLPSREVWDEKLGDLDCYIHLLDGLLLSRLLSEEIK